MSDKAQKWVAIAALPAFGVFLWMGVFGAHLTGHIVVDFTIAIVVMVIVTMVVGVSVYYPSPRRARDKGVLLPTPPDWEDTTGCWNKAALAEAERRRRGK